MRQRSLWNNFLTIVKDPRKSRRRVFLECMDRAVPWAALLAELGDDVSGSHLGRKPMGVDRKLRVYFVSLWFGLTDQETIDLLLDSPLVAEFCGFDSALEHMPDRSTLAKFRNWLMAHHFADTLEDVVDAALETVAIKLGGGTMVDSTVIEAPRSTKNKAKARDPDAGSTQKRGSWFFGYKVHIGTDDEHVRIHTATVTAANPHDSQELGNLLHGDETAVYGDSAYVGQEELLALHAPEAEDRICERGVRNQPLTEEQKARNRKKSKRRAKVEHPFRVLKCQFKQRRTRYRGLARNEHHFRVLCALVNVYTFRHVLAAATPF